jgi:hypothetical protein
MNNNVNSFLEKLKSKNVTYAVITGIYEEEGALVEKRDTNFIEDLDIVFFDISCTDLKALLLVMGVEHIINNTYSYKTKEGVLPIDIYIEAINVGYYYLFRLNTEDIIAQDDKMIIREDDYVMYQFLEPLIKFSDYKKRHRHRLNKYLDNGYLTEDIKQRLYAIIGKYSTEYIITSLQKETKISKFFIKLVKIKLLFINHNFFRLFNKRVLKNDKCLY